MTNWREVFGYRARVRPAPEGYKEGNPPYSEDEDFDPEGKVHEYAVDFEETNHGVGMLFGRCQREVIDRYGSGLQELRNQEIYETDNFVINWNSLQDEGLARRYQ
jgi:hypothetical protein